MPEYPNPIREYHRFTEPLAAKKGDETIEAIGVEQFFNLIKEYKGHGGQKHIRIIVQGEIPEDVLTLQIPPVHYAVQITKEGAILLNPYDNMDRHDPTKILKPQTKWSAEIYSKG